MGLRCTRGGCRLRGPRRSRHPQRRLGSEVFLTLSLRLAAPGGPPGAEGGFGLVGGEGAALEAQVLEEAPRLADLAARRDAQDLHDRVAVEVGPDPVQVL